MLAPTGPGAGDNTLIFNSELFQVFHVASFVSYLRGTKRAAKTSKAVRLLQDLKRTPA